MTGEAVASARVMGAPCPDSRELQLLVKGRLPAARHEIIEQHILDCTLCQAALASIDDAVSTEKSLFGWVCDFADPVPGIDASSSAQQSIELPVSDSIQTLGDYRVIREIGRGGMGLVFEAEQISLRRRVALKTLPMAALLDPKRLQRFKNEAHAAALLHHQNIVPVYSFGVDRGVHYYAMQYIEGVNLARLLRMIQLEAAGQAHEAPAGPTATHRHGLSVNVHPNESYRTDQQADTGTAGCTTETPDIRQEDPADFEITDATSSHSELVTARRTKSRNYFRRVAELGMQAADALHFAHEQGVVHRDIKPSNLMIDPSGRLWVTDFGLAQLETEGSLTMSGDLIGTLRYMSPEQSSGKPSRVDFRTDVYSLGATLYEMLALQPLFPDADRQAILVCIANSEPRALRSVDPEIPTDLETIVSKALAKEPLDRYSSAGELAEDLRRFLDDIPIRAKRPTPLERGIKWVRRHNRLVTVAATLIAIMLCLVVAGTVLLAAAWQRESQQRQFAEEAAREATAKSDEAQTQRQRAEKNFRSALQAVDEMFTQVGVADLADIPQMEPVRRALTQRALTFYQGFLAERGDDPDLAYETGRAWVRVGYVRRLLGELDEAEKAARQGMAIFEKLGSEQSENSVHRLDLMSAYEEIAMDLMFAQRHDDAVAIRQRALALIETVVRDFPEPAHHWIRLADAQSAFGNSFIKSSRRISDAEPYHRQALATLEFVKSHYPDEDLLGQFAHKNHWLGACLLLQKRYQDAQPILRHAIELREEQLRKTPNSAGVKHDLAHAISYYSKLPIRSGDESDREALMQRNIALMKGLVGDFPSTREQVTHLSMAYTSYGHFLMSYDRFPEARSAFVEQLALLGKSHAKFPVKGGEHGSIGWAYNSLGRCLQEMGKSDEARDAFRAAHEHFEQLAVELPEFTRGQWYLAVYLTECPEPALRDVVRAKELLTRIIAKSPETREYWGTLAAIECESKNWGGMRDALEKAATLADEPVPISERFGLAIAHWHLGAKDAAVESYRSAVVEMERLAIRDYDTRKLRSKASATLGKL